MRRKVLFLGYSTSPLIDLLRGHGNDIDHLEGPIDRDVAGYDVIISFGYRHILKKSFIDSAPPIVNLHMSLLPYNRGAHPNFWSFVEDTPKGVTIHLIDEGIDTGPIIYQREISFNETEDSFSKTYTRLIAEMEDLFASNIDSIVSLDFTARPQRGEGTFHRASDLPALLTSWDMPIEETLRKLRVV
ncbi:formyltransferase family protein [Caballeronia sp. LP006]|uniref:formyltransferase family protein n=1 Tax=Caballeronia sp. LP006 TaxID=3038552 RepID=UPI00285BF32D|nr:formyltransferase family protein [Caballeronia sp. LP006]MDR5831958.1 formyltransferase family protein [Caballeronia sp. LP006]